MSAISLKSITGITSITTPAGVDNQLTLHNNNTTEAVKLDTAGNLHFHNHLNITGISTAANFKTGTSNLHNTGLNVFDLDVDGHTNLDNVNIAGFTTFAQSINVLGSMTGESVVLNAGSPTIFLNDLDTNSDFSIQCNGGLLKFMDTTNSYALRLSINSSGNVAIARDLDVDGHTNLDNTDIVGILTVTSTTQYGGYKLSNNSSIVGELVGLSGSNDTGALALWSGGSKYIQLSAVGNSYITGGEVLIGTTTGTGNNLTVQDAGTSTTAGGNIVARFQSNGSGRDATIQLSDNVANSATISMLSSALILKQSGTETVRITSGGSVLINTTVDTEASSDGNELIIGSTSNTHAGMSIVGSTTGGIGSIIFTDGASYKNQGIIQYRHADNSMRFTVDQYEALRIFADGEVRVNATKGTNNVPAHLRLHCGDASISAGQAVGQLRFAGRDAGGAAVSRTGALIQATASNDWDTTQTSGYAASHLDFFTQNQSGTDTIAAGARLRIDSNGKIGINLTNPGDYNSSANNLVVHSSPSVNDAGITIRSNYAGSGGLYFADGTGTSSDKGYIIYGQSNDTMYLGVNRGSKLQINSSGAFGLAGSNYGSSGQVLTSQGSGSAVQWATPASATNSPAFSAKMSAYQNCSGGNVVQFNQEHFDTDGCYDTSTYRFTPNVAGNYLITFTFYMYGSSGGILAGSNGEIIHSNYGTISKFWIDPMQNLSNQLNRSGNSGSVIIPFNGSSEYVYVNAYGLTTTGGTPRIDNNGANFSGMKLA